MWYVSRLSNDESHGSGTCSSWKPYKVYLEKINHWKEILFWLITSFGNIVSLIHLRSHAVEWSDSGVRVNCVAPGVIFSQTARDNYAFDVFSAAKPHIPAKRLGTPEEVIRNNWENNKIVWYIILIWSIDIICRPKYSFTLHFRYLQRFAFCCLRGAHSSPGQPLE